MTHTEVSRLSHEHRRAYESGQTTQQISLTTGLPVGTIRHRLRVASAKMRRPGTAAAPLQGRVYELLALVKSGHSLAAAGRAYGISRERVRQLVRQHGMTQRKAL